MLTNGNGVYGNRVPKTPFERIDRDDISRVMCLHTKCRCLSFI